MIRPHPSILVAMALLVALGTSCGDDEPGPWCALEIPCKVDDCSCTVDEDCTVEQCAFVPNEWPRPEDQGCYWCVACSNGYPVPTTVWAGLRERWLDSCGAWLCTSDCSSDYDCCADCIYVAACKAGQCGGVISEEHPTGWCG